MKIIIDERDEVDLIWIHNGSINLPKKYENEEHVDNHSNDVKSYENIFPWLTKFNKIMCSSVGHRSYQVLKRLLSLYTQNILTNINTYCEKTLDMIKLKNHLSSTLTFFHLYWHDIKEHVDDCTLYLNKMSVLLGIYIDMELKTFKHAMDASKIASKLLSALWIYLSNSEKHIFRVLLKLKLVTKKYSKICDPIFMRSFTRLKQNVEAVTDIDYVRYLLVLKVWKKIKENVEEKKEVNKMALTILGPRIPKMRDELLEIIPKSPIEHENETIWLLQQNVFDLRTACNNFIAFEETMSVTLKVSDLNFQLSQNVLCNMQGCFTNHELKKSEMNNLKDNHSFQTEVKCNTLTNQVFPLSKRNKFKKHKKVSKLKPGEVILIDLTEEEELRIDKTKKKSKSKKKLEWLKIMKKKYNTRRQTVDVKNRNHVEIADAHSTENSENFADKILLEYLPISDNKVSESIESYTLLEQKPVQDNTHYNSQNMHDHILNKRNKELKYMFQHKQCDTCTSSLKQTDIHRNRVLYLLKLLSTVGQNINEPKTILNLLREKGDENIMSSTNTFFCKNTDNESNEINTQGKEESFPQPKSCIEAILSLKECQNSITNVQSIKQELPTNKNCNMTEANTYCQNESVYVQSNYHLHDFSSMNSLSSQTTETVKQRVAHNIHECADCCKKIEIKPFSYHNNSIFNTIKTEDIPKNTIDTNATDKKPICDKNIICMLSDLDKCMDVLNRIGEHIMTVHAEKQRLKCLDKMDLCTVSTTVLGDQCVESSSDWLQNINSLTNTEKLSRILELYGKKDLLNVCNCHDFHRWDNQETNAVLNQLKSESENCQKVTISTSQPKENRSYEKDNIFSENKSPPNFVFNHIKSEIEQSIQKASNENFEVLRDETQKTNHKMNTLTNNQTFDTFIHDLKDTKESNRDIHCESVLQNFSQKSNVTKINSMDEFENIDILDSILNGDITIEDEQELWENSQSPLMSPINYDNSNNVLNCITEFFSQSEHSCTNETEKKYIVSDTKNSQTPLPEGSLGTTGILNSLFDFDLTNMDSPSNDFMYSNIQAVNPRLIKKTFEKTFANERNNLEKLFPQKEKELCNNQNHSIDSSVDVVGFGLNTSKKKVLEFPSLVKSISSFSGQPTVLVNSDNISSEAKESFPKCSLSSPTDKFDTNSVIGKSYIFHKKDIINQIQSFNDTANRDLPEICTSTDIQSNVSMNCTLSQQDDIQSSHKHTRVELETNPLVIKQSLDSCDLLSSTDFTTDTTLQCVEQKQGNFLKQKNIQHSCKEKQNHITQHKIKINAQSRSCKRTLRCKKKIKMKNEKEKLPSSVAQPNQNELSLRCSQITVINPLNYQDVQDTCESPLSTFHVSYRQKSLQTMCTSKNIHKQLKCVGIQQLRNISQQKQQMLLNFREDSIRDIIVKEDTKLENVQHTMEDNISEDSNISCVSEKSYIPESKTCFKFSKRNMKITTGVAKVNLTTDKNVIPVSNNILVKSGTKWSLQNIDTQPSEFIEEQIVTTLDEDTPSKRRKLTSKFSPILKTNTVVSSVNEQKIQKKYFDST
ncbi:PREDICTED: uncharacterized protein LOC108572567, partial [Habropoda laboriosa]|uniref:uncharacterized protein LOC108572567 n=1 Tax=Habropoda laboriosa TaxID=597456 RepID=UPI00083E0B80